MVMAAKYRAQHLSFNVDLCEQAVYYLDFLKIAAGVPHLKEPEILRRAVYRYETFWLPLAADLPEESLAAPLDIEWVWHCHMLNPKSYETDCYKIVGAIVNHTLYNRREHLEKQKTTEKIWSYTYRSKTEPFAFNRNVKYDIKEVENHQSKISCNIVATAEKQFEFYYQVSLPHYHDSRFLQNSLIRYKQYLYLKKVTQEDIMPGCDIDLIWHTHLLNHVAYKQDTVRIFGNLLNYDETFHNHSEVLALHESVKEAEETWKTFFHEKYFLSGTTYRRLPPTTCLYNTRRDDVFIFGAKSCKFTIDTLTLKLSSELYRKVRLTGLGLRDGPSMNKLFTLKQQISSSVETVDIVWKDVGCYELNTTSVYGIRFQLQLWLGRHCCQANETSLSTDAIEILQFLDDEPRAANGGKLNFQMDFDNSSLDIQGRLSPVHCEKVVLFLKRGHYHIAALPQYVIPLLGPVVMNRCQSEINKKCLIATHSMNPLLPGAYKTEITVHMIQNDLLDMSLIQVFYNDKMAAFAHIIDSDQLPLPTQVATDEITLDPVKGEKAVLIKNNKGDWGILHGRWDYARRTDYEASILHKPETFSVKFYKFYTGVTTSICLDLFSDIYNFSLDSSEVDLKKGILRIDTLQKEIAENIAMAFSVSLLYVLCVPRPNVLKTNNQLESDIKAQDKQTEPFINSDEMAFLLAAGSALKTLSK